MPVSGLFRPCTLPGGERGRTTADQVSKGRTFGSAAKSEKGEISKGKVALPPKGEVHLHGRKEKKKKEKKRKRQQMRRRG